MEWQPLIVVAHVVGAAIGVGGALATDSVFLRAIRNRRISSEQFVLIRAVSDVVLVGLGLVALTGVALVLLSPELINQAAFLAKMLIVVVLLVNGLLFHLVALPYLTRHRDQWLGSEVLSRGRRIAFATTGALSGVSWLGALILGASDPPEVGLPVKVAIYFVIAVGASILAFLILSHILFAPAPDPRDEAETGTLGEGPAGIEWEAFVIAGITIVVIGALTLVGLGVVA